MECVKCSRKLHSGWAFCPGCGIQLEPGRAGTAKDHVGPMLKNLNPRDIDRIFARLLRGGGAEGMIGADQPPSPATRQRKVDSGVRAQVFEVIVRQAMAGAPWREICAGPMAVNNISADDVEDEVRRRTGQPPLIRKQTDGPAAQPRSPLPEAERGPGFGIVPYVQLEGEVDTVVSRLEGIYDVLCALAEKYGQREGVKSQHLNPLLAEFNRLLGHLREIERKALDDSTEDAELDVSGQAALDASEPAEQDGGECEQRPSSDCEKVDDGPLQQDLERELNRRKPPIDPPGGDAPHHVDWGSN